MRNWSNWFLRALGQAQEEQEAQKEDEESHLYSHEFPERFLSVTPEDR